jgi:hypothetical protein
VRADGREQQVAGAHALALRGSGGRVTFEALHPAHCLILSAAEIREPVLMDGSFIMNEPSHVAIPGVRPPAGRDRAYLAIFETLPATSLLVNARC